MQKRYIIGIDEAGRGPLAGPVAVGTVKILKGRKPAVLRFARDSKQISEKERERIYCLMIEALKKGEIDFYVSFSSAKYIDKKGIVSAIQNALHKNLKKLQVQVIDEIFLDGSLKAPDIYKKQKTIIKGDSLVPIIGLASIAAKVLRDRYMKKISKKYPQYGLDIHKGYGTVLHRKAIKKHGFSAQHRKSFVLK